ncbi:MAG: hypothetical protein KDA74_20875, partial [Planctomycetaceae bacterium]|nr:hypothetical protein [Planctomycetaceae bacterium]
ILQEAGTGQEYVDQFYAEQGGNVAGSEAFLSVFGNKKQRKEISETQKQIDVNERARLAGLAQEDQAGAGVRFAAARFNTVANERIRVEANFNDIDFSGIQEASKNVVKQFQQAAAEAADAITQQAMANLNAVKTMQGAVTKGYADMQKQFEQFQLIQKNYGSGTFP